MIKQAEKKGSPYLFPKSDGTRIKSIRTAFTNAGQHAKLRDVTPHTLRYTLASRLATRVNDVTIEKLGKWKDPKNG
jgi:integrase